LRFKLKMAAGAIHPAAIFKRKKPQGLLACGFV
jgi:hypothetical protein